MKKLLLALTFLAVAFSAQAQLDSILWEPFDVDNTLDYSAFPDGADLGWVNFDEDGLAPSTGDDADRQWVFGTAFVQFDTILVNNCLRSRSWMEGFAVGNRNWLMLPPQQIVGNDVTFHWKSAPLQLFRYMDGYQIMVSTTGNNPEDFTDTLFVAAQMTDIIGDADVQIVDNFEFSDGYIHSNSGQDSTYWVLFTEDDSTLYAGVLEPHSVSLAQYAGQKIYLAVLHNSDDDNLLSVDDLLVAKGSSVAVKDEFEKNLRFVAYPNPADILLNVLFRTDATVETSKIEVYSADGKLAMAKNLGRLTQGEHSLSVPTARLTTGNYVLRLTIGEREIAHPFIVR